MMKLRLSVITLVLICVIVENQASKYIGVYWHKPTKKWRVQLKHNQKIVYGGLFENEEHAAMNVNSLCDRLGIEHKNPTIKIELDKIQEVQHHTSPYTGVSWDNNVKKWQVDLMHKKKKYFGGYFENEKDAAMKVNLLCDEFGIQRKNPTIMIEPDAIEQKFRNETSKYNGVHWDTKRKRWRSLLTVNKHVYSGGYFKNEEDAAMSANLVCDKYEVERKNPTINITTFEAYQAQNLTSQYIGVSWDKNNKKWRARLIHKGKKYSAGLFDNEKHAAMKLNLLCDKFGIQRKNPMINIKFDDIRQKTKSPKMYESKVENMGNEKEVKVEEENILYGLKDQQCENNFMERPCQNQKRKRKNDSILTDVIEEQIINTNPNHDENKVFEEIQENYIKTHHYTIPQKYHFNQF